MEKFNLTTVSHTCVSALLVAVIFCGCIDHRPKNESEFKIIVVDSCEYIHSYQGADDGTLFSHKGNCKFCAERNKK